MRSERGPTNNIYQMGQQVDFANIVPRNRHGRPAGIHAEGIIQSDEPPPELKSPFGDFYFGLINMHKYKQLQLFYRGGMIHKLLYVFFIRFFDLLSDINLANCTIYWQ